MIFTKIRESGAIAGAILSLTSCMVSGPAAADEHVALSSKGAPHPIGPYSPGIEVGRFLFLSGQIAIDPTGKVDVRSLDVEAQTHRAMDNLIAVLAAAGLSPKDITTTTLYLLDMKDFEAVNHAYGSYFAGSPPARATVQVAGLPRGAKIEISAIAVRP